MNHWGWILEVVKGGTQKTRVLRMLSCRQQKIEYSNSSPKPQVYTYIPGVLENNTLELKKHSWKLPILVTMIGSRFGNVRYTPEN